MSDEDDGAPRALGDGGKRIHKRANIVCAVHIDVCADKGLKWVEDKEFCAAFADSVLDTGIAQGKRKVTRFKKGDILAICADAFKAWLDCVLNTVLGILVDNDLRRNVGIGTARKRGTI
ncbi:hypothetical protein FACS1894211_14480 [Clostridia bacterium]|nr:hypothetical protein FACS1894211_14480 [Clostridia bacterium]